MISPTLYFWICKTQLRMISWRLGLPLSTSRDMKTQSLLTMMVMRTALAKLEISAMKSLVSMMATMDYGCQWLLYLFHMERWPFDVSGHRQTWGWTEQSRCHWSGWPGQPGAWHQCQDWSPLLQQHLGHLELAGELRRSSWHSNWVTDCHQVAVELTARQSCPSVGTGRCGGAPLGKRWGKCWTAVDQRFTCHCHLRHAAVKEELRMASILGIWGHSTNF